MSGFVPGFDVFHHYSVLNCPLQNGQ